jgi:ectoine hydroxylase-related dioxygenase (phytanoyl-CoA dioxygenase family)
MSVGRVVRAAKRLLRRPAALRRSAVSPLRGGDAATSAGAWSQDPALLPWYDRPDWAEHVARAQRNRASDDAEAAMLRKWCEEGYVIVPGLVPGELIDAFVHEIDHVWERSDPIAELIVSDVVLDDGYHVHAPHSELVRLGVEQRRRIRDISNWRIGEYHLSSAAARRIFDYPEIVRIASAIFARRAEARYSLMFSKGTEQGLHQDTCVFHIFPRDFMMGIWIACEDIRPDSGPLEYYPRSHREPLFAEFTNYPQTNRRTSDPEQSRRYDEYVANLAKSFQKHELLIRKGDVMFWHPMLIHGGAPRLDRNATRKSFVLHYIAEGCDVGGRVRGPFNW